MSYDAWKTTPPDYCGSHDADPEQAFWQGFRFAQRHGTVEAYLAIYRDARTFRSLVARAERMPHVSECDCQICRGAA